jgi:hypothetical protein
MFEKTKEFCKNHKAEIILGTVGVITVVGAVIVGKKLLTIEKPGQTVLTPTSGRYDWKAERDLLESFGAVIEDGYDGAFASEEVAIKFLKERGSTYQIDIMDDFTSVIWINNLDKL